MAVENVAKFVEKIQTDETLSAKINDAAAAYVKDHPEDAENEKAVFDAAVAPIAAEVGLPITYNEAKSVLADEDASAQLDLGDLDAVAGGAQCFAVGLGSGVGARKIGVTACGGIGVGFIDTGN